MSQQLFALCRKLSKTEWKALHLFVAPPAHNTREDVGRLLRYLEHYLPKNKEKYVEKTFIFQKIYPERTEYDDDYWRYTTHLTHRLLRDFLVYQHAQANVIGQQIHFVQSLRERKVERNFELAWRETLQTLETQPLRNSDYYYDSYRLHLEQYEFSIAQRRTEPASFQELNDALNIFFMTQKLRQACAALSHRALSKTEFKIDFLEQVLTYIASTEKALQLPTVAAYYHIYHALTDLNDGTHFKALKGILLDFATVFPAQELKDLYIHAINCCIKRLNAGQRDYLREVFDLYKNGLNVSIFLENGVLSRYTYNNIAMAGVGLQEFDWVEKFLTEFKPFLEEKYRESIFQHTLAMYYFKKPDYAKAQQLLQQTEFDDVLHNLDARRMLLRIYYDTQDWDSLEAHLDNFKIYLYRQKDLGYHQENYLNLIRFTRKLLSLDYEKNALRAEIEATVALVEKGWLLEKVLPS
jgi:hypothetical protein